MIPGNPHPLLMAGGGDPLDDYGVIARSLRIRAAANAYLTRTFAAGGNRKTWTLNWWPKFCRSIPAASEVLIENYDLGTNHFGIFKTNDTIRIYWAIGGSVLCDLVTTRVFRDFGAFPNLHVRIDTTQAVAANRVRLYCNGEQVTVFTTATYPAQNSDLYFNAPFSHTIGRSTAGGQNFDGYNAFMAFVDGQSLDPSSFGIFHPVTGQWRPKNKAQVKAVVDAGGINSFFLPFDDTTNTTTLCADASTKGNNWTPTNISLSAGATYDSMTDTPTNVFCTLNPLDVASVSVSNGNLTATAIASISSQFARGTIQLPNSGKWYWENNLSSGALGAFGVTLTSAPMLDGGFATYTSTIDYMSAGTKNVNGVETAYGAAYTTGDIIGVAFDADAGNLTFYKNNVSQGVIAVSPSVGYSPSLRVWSSCISQSNFGQRSFTYTPPAGHKTLCTKNLTQPNNGAVVKPSTAFVTVTDSGANVQTTLANARAGWVNYIEIFKRRDASEGWRWRFSDDLGYALESNNANAKIAFPALTGTSYLGEAIKVAVGNGVTTGRLTHVNGVADTVTDGLGNARKMLMLRNEAGGNWFVYHPELTAGKLLYLNLQNAETTDATISTVLSNSFVVAAALASGTYRWIAFAEIEGFLKLWKYIGNGNVNGPFHNDMLTPNAVWWKDANTGTNNWHTHDIARDPYNQSNANLMFNLSDAESSQHGMDLISNGGKIRNSASGSNLNGTKQVGISFAASPFRYSNAR